VIEQRHRAYPLTSLAFWGAYWTTLRPYLFFVSGVAGLVGLAMPKGISWVAFVVAFVGLFLSYGLGQALTDVYQTDTDAISSPYRPLTQGLISGGQVLAVSLTGLSLIAVALFFLNPWTLVLSAVGIVGLAIYTPLKRHWWGGPLWNAWIVALLPAIGYLCGESSIATVFRSKVLWAAMVSVLFSYAIFVLLGYFKDISADRATGYETLPVRYGWVPAIVVSGIFAVICFGASGLLMHWALPLETVGALHGVQVAFLWMAGVAMLSAAHVLLLRTRREGESHRAISFVVRGFVLLHLGEAVALEPKLALPALVFYVAFESSLTLRPERTQI
jgi:4-hydroxybenzoate polyprenyltransferase